MKTRITKWSLIGDLKKYWQYRYERKRLNRSSLGGLCWISTTTTKLSDTLARPTLTLELSHGCMQLNSGWRFEFLRNYSLYNRVLLSSLAPLPPPRASDCYDMSNQLPANVVLLLQLFPIPSCSFLNICLLCFQIASAQTLQCMFSHIIVSPFH